MNRILFKISDEVKVKVGSAVIVFILGSAVATLLAMQAGASAGRDALRQNNDQHPKLQSQIDSLKMCEIRQESNDKLILEKISTVEVQTQETQENVRMLTKHLLRAE